MTPGLDKRLLRKSNDIMKGLEIQQRSIGSLFSVLLFDASIASTQHSRLAIVVSRKKVTYKASRASDPLMNEVTSSCLDWFGSRGIESLAKPFSS